MIFSERTLSLLALIATGLSVLAIVFATVGAGGRRRPRASQGGVPLDEALRAVVEGQAGRIERLEKAARVLNARDNKQQIAIEGGVRRVSMLRYDAFEDVGGRLSFSCALLDEHGTGVVLTSINGRQETRVYAKPITDGVSSYNLSSEEAEAIRQALSAAPEQTVEAR
jgi:Protein of unknown function (DUF4446)